MIYKQPDFNNCQFNPLVDQPMLDAYPKLNEIIEQEWRDDSLDGILRYIIIVYDPKSPLINFERDLNYRKEIAINLSKLSDFDTAAAVLTNIHNYSPALIIKYLMRFARSKEWAAICAFEFSFWESIKEVTEPISGKSSKEKLESVQKKSTIKEEIVKDMRQLDALYKTFFGEDDDLHAKSKRRLTPEMIANGK